MSTVSKTGNNSKRTLVEKKNLRDCVISKHIEDSEKDSVESNCDEDEYYSNGDEQTEWMNCSCACK